MVREGKPLYVALEQSGVIDDLALDMVKVGETTGALATMLTNIADFLDQEVEIQMQRLLSLVEPLMLVFMGIVVALLLDLRVPADVQRPRPGEVDADARGRLEPERTAPSHHCPNSERDSEMALQEDVQLFEKAKERLRGEAEAAAALAARFGLEYVDVTRFRIDNDLFRCGAVRPDAALPLHPRSARPTAACRSSSPTPPTW